MRSAKRIGLLFFDTDFHVTALTVYVLVERLRVAFVIGDRIARISPFGAVLRLHDDTPRPIPGSSAIGDVGEKPLRGAASKVGVLGGLDKRAGEAIEPVIVGKPDELAHIVALTPGEQPPATKARIAAKDNAHGGPGLAKALDQQRENRPGVLSAIDLARAQIAHQ